MRILRISGFILLVFLLTATTQVGGIILLLCIPLFRFIKRKYKVRYKRRLANVLSFTCIYCLLTFTAVPWVASLGGRVPLPAISNARLKPLNFLTVLMNRHYVTPKMRSTIEEVAEKMNDKNPGTIVAYLDANFPFINGFPLLPHLSHNDGRKLDIALFYTDAESHEPINRDAPSFIGYGVYEEPKQGESDWPSKCSKRGHSQYSIIGFFIPQWNKDDMPFDQKRTSAFIKLLTKHKSVEKIFIEPHLKQRMHLSSGKIRFHGCQAVRHDDHIHFQVR